MSVDDIVYHKRDPTKEPLTVVKRFMWLSNYKLQCRDSSGEFTKDWEHEFIKIET